jgi:hypothetical protein
VVREPASQRLALALFLLRVRPRSQVRFPERLSLSRLNGAR